MADVRIRTHPGELLLEEFMIMLRAGWGVCAAVRIWARSAVQFILKSYWVNIHSPPTAYRALGPTVLSTCRSCGYVSELDRAHYMSEQEMEMDDIRFVCRLCGGRRVGLLVGEQWRDGTAANR